MARGAGALPSFVVLAVAMAGVSSPALTQQPAPAPQSAPAARQVTTSVQVPIEGTANGACQGDLVSLKGELNAVAKVHMTPKLNTVEVYLSLHNVKGVGSTSGLRYLGLGQAQFSAETDSGLPTLPGYRANFLLWGVGTPPKACVGEPNKVLPLPVTVALKFDIDGALAGAEASIRSSTR